MRIAHENIINVGGQPGNQVFAFRVESHVAPIVADGGLVAVHFPLRAGGAHRHTGGDFPLGVPEEDVVGTVRVVRHEIDGFPLESDVPAVAADGGIVAGVAPPGADTSVPAELTETLDVIPVSVSWRNTS